MDYALKGWLDNNLKLKPLLGKGYHYEDHYGNADIYTEGVDRFYHEPLIAPGVQRLLRFDWSPTNNPSDRYEIFSHAAQAWCDPLGKEVTNVKMFDHSINLGVWKYDKVHYSHSRQFRSNIVKEKPYWEKVLELMK